MGAGMLVGDGEAAVVEGINATEARRLTKAAETHLARISITIFLSQL